MGINYKENNQWKEVKVKVGDNIPVGTIVEFDGQTIPVGWEAYTTGKIKKVSQTVPTIAQVVDGHSDSTTDSYSCNYVNTLGFLPKNSSMHNSIYRGADITDLFYNGTLSTQIANGTFDDIFIGDYIIGQNSGRKYIVADLNYYLNTGESNICTTNHILMIPEKTIGSAKMNDTGTTSGGYAGSKMHTTNLTSSKTIINNDFGSSHILQHDVLLTTSVSNDIANGWNWYSITVELMSEMMTVGCNATSARGQLETGVEKGQLALFRLNKAIIGAKNDSNVRTTYWLRNVNSNSAFANIADANASGDIPANYEIGVRPFFLLY